MTSNGTNSPSADGFMQPRGLLDDKGNYCMQQKTFYDLSKYLWAGVLLPTTVDGLRREINLADSFEDQLLPMVKDLITTYISIHGHCSAFKDSQDTGFPAIVHLADDAYHYAQTAGGTAAGSYYANIIALYLQLVDETAKAQPDPATVKDLTDSINQLIAIKVAEIEALKARATGVTQLLTNFEGVTKQDQHDLQLSGAAITEFLVGEEGPDGKGGEIGRLQQDLQDNQAKLASNQSEYEQGQYTSYVFHKYLLIKKDVINACTALTYVWIVPAGTLAAAGVMAYYAQDAIKMKSLIEGEQVIISDDQNQIAADKALVAHLTMIQTSLDNITNLIGPAITAIEALMGYWDSIASDLQSVEDFVKTNSATGPAIVQKINQNSIVNMWNTLQASLDQYRKMAYISPSPQPTSADQWVKDLDSAMAKLNTSPNLASDTVPIVDADDDQAQGSGCEDVVEVDVIVVESS